ncbi:MAG: hypothetical protein M1386_02185 [Candidatus Thermoplasmatota archaeon]|nr:hypothetical protein [Candidatus Thermoplasmatota archaeon]
MKDEDWIADFILPAKYRRRFEKIGKALDERQAIQLAVESIIDFVPGFIQRIVGINITLDPKSRSEIVEETTRVMLEFLEATKKAEKIPAENYCERLKIVTDPILKQINSASKSRRKRYRSFFEYYDQYLKSSLFSDPSGFYLAVTKLAEYRSAFYSLLDEVFLRKGSSETYENLVAHTSFLTEMMPIPRRITSFNNYYTFLDKRFAKFREESIYKLIEIYYDFAEVTAKFLGMVRILLDSLEGKNHTNLESIYSDSLHNHLIVIKGSSKYGILGDLDAVIRNSISHRSYIFDKEHKRIIFKDRNKSVSVKTREFLEKTRNISALQMTLSSLQLYVAYKKNQSILSACFSKEKLGI